MRTRKGAIRAKRGRPFQEKIYLLCQRRYTYFADEVYLLLKVSSIALPFQPEDIHKKSLDILSQVSKHTSPFIFRYFTIYVDILFFLGGGVFYMKRT